MLKSTKVGHYMAKELMGVNAKRRHKKWVERHKRFVKRRMEIDGMIRVYGKVRYYLSLWFGQWVLYSWRRPPG